MLGMKVSTINYLLEFRKRLLKAAGLTLLLFIIFFCYANQIFDVIASPLLKHIQGPMIATNVTAPLLVPIELAAKLACITSMPYFLYQLWAFITPALYQHEGKIFKTTYLASLCLFICGLLFCYYIALPLLFGFFVDATTANIKLMPDISQYLSLTGRFFLLFGLSFQIPVVIFFLLKSQLLSINQLQSARAYMIVSAFILGMLLTPPDVLSQVLLAVPMCLLYELGILAGKKLKI